MDHVLRTDLGGRAPLDRGECVAALVHLSDLHVVDPVSPARAEWIELRALDPRWKPLLHMHRPQEAMAHWALAAHVAALAAAPVAPWSGARYDLVLSTGDNIDNGQFNELDAYLAIVLGGRTRLSAAGGPHDPSGAALGSPWPFWAPEPGVADTWKAQGYPAVPDFLARVGAEVISSGLGVPFASLPGNHDIMRQGTAFSPPALEALAVGAAKSLHSPAGFEPPDPLSLYVDRPDLFSLGATHAITPDAGRRLVDRSGWIERHAVAGVRGYGPSSALTPSGDTVVDLEHVRLVLLDTNHPEGDYQGSIGLDQLAWLDARLGEVGDGRVTLVASHHGTDTLVNTRGDRADRVLAAAFHAVVQRHPRVLAWLVGHRHIHRVAARVGPYGGHWEITTGSVIDWPSQGRAVEVVRHADGSFELVCTMLDHGAPAGSLAALHREVAHRFAGPALAAMIEGAPTDRDVRLVCPLR